MNLRWGVMPFRLDFTDNAEENILRTFKVGEELVFSYSKDDEVLVCSECAA